MTIGRITSVSVTGDASLAVAWDDGHIAAVDLASRIAARRALASLCDPHVFAQVTVAEDGWSLEWPTGIDFGAAQLRRWADEQSGSTMLAADFRDWVRTRGLTPERVGDALGLSDHTVAAYLSGEQPVPKTVMLATEGYDRRATA